MPEARQVGATELRAMFNDGEYYERVRDGELFALVTWHGTPVPRSGQPPGTESQELAYFDGGTVVARVHQFLLPDGTIGASGRPDPKAVLQGDVLFVLDPEAE